MRFGPVPLSEAEGAILAHGTDAGGASYRKGRRLSAEDVAALAAAGVVQVFVARLEPTDVGEDEAARRVAEAIAGGGLTIAAPFTGRANLFAAAAGLARIDAGRLVALNGFDEGLTVATLAPFERVAPGQMVATVKVIPFALPAAVVEAAERQARSGEPLVSLAAFRPLRAGLVLTTVPGTRTSVIDKRRRAIADRLAGAGSTVARAVVCAHEAGAVEREVRAMVDGGLDPVLVFAGSAIVDREDVVPEAVARAGGRVIHLGMPVDPGNLLMLGEVGTTRVVGVPSCAASPKLNGFDWVLERLLAGLPVGRPEIVAMAPGGLLKEIDSRPQPRAGDAAKAARRSPRIAALVLAAGRSSRMGERNKLLERVGGTPIVRRTVEAALGSSARPVVVVTGHQQEAVRAALDGLPVELVANPRFADGLSTSLAAGLAVLAESIDGALVMLGDMPEIAADHLDRLIAAFAPKEARSIVVPVWQGRRGNPVLWSRAMFAQMQELRGDTGARHLLAQHTEEVVEVELGTEAVLADVDTPASLAELRARLESDAG